MSGVVPENEFESPHRLRSGFSVINRNPECKLWFEVLVRIARALVCVLLIDSRGSLAARRVCASQGDPSPDAIRILFIMGVS